MLFAPGAGHADCATDVGANPTPLGPYLFPNWTLAHVASFTIEECADATCAFCANGPMSGLTIANLGTAGSADVTKLYWRITCGGLDTGYQTMTYAGTFNFSWGASNAWTWSGVSAWADACAGCACGMALDIYADLAPCPADGKTVQMALGFNDVLNPGWPGGLYDSCACAAPWAQVADPLIRFIKYVAKVGDPDVVAPGDTLTYTIYYGRPGTTALSSVTVLDTQPPFTHYLPGFGTAPDPLWDPDPGPPLRLRWTQPGGVTTGGPTGEVDFQLTVDWGNGESFEPGSGDVAAPEGSWLVNSAAATFNGTSCPAQTFFSDPTQTVVRRFLFWKVGDNDVLYSNALGQPPDEMTYAIFIKNTSLSKTWWNVSIWDTVPAELDPWGTGFGLEDPCTGWTMTPSGCAAASAGWIVNAAKATLLTWKLDMPPQQTLELHWKASVRPTVTAGATAINIASVLELGRAGVFNGTGSSGVPRRFTHQAAIVLQTTYVSYIGIAAANNNFWTCSNTGPMATQTYWISFFPLNKKADFNLYEQLHNGDAFEAVGGASPSINGYVGGCLTGGASWIPGCKVERAPAHYKPAAFAACPGPTNIHHLYKLVSNSPLLWELLTADLKNDADASTYDGTTSLTYGGYTSYSYSRMNTYPQFTDALYIVNTSAVTPTTVHVFQWDPATLSWSYQATSDINKESMWLYNPDTAESYRVISSDSPMIIFKGYPGIGAGGAFNDSGSQAPNKENGYLVSTTVPATFYAFCGGPASDGASLVVGNVGATDARYEIWEYFSDTPTVTNPTTTHLTTQLLGNSGSWTMLAVDSVPAGLANANNPHVYGAGYDRLINDTYTMYKVKLISGGAIQVYNGRDVYSGYGCGSVMHAVTPPLGTQYWFQESEANNDCGGADNDIMTLDFYCPRQGTVVTAVSGDGASASYTTPGADSCVSFKHLTTPAAPGRRNWKITSVGGVIAVAHQIHCQLAEKIYTAPFLNQGVHYTIIAPPTAFAGQSFWITVLVSSTGGATQTDYCGTTSFTSTDPTAQMSGVGMDTYNYTWDSNDVAAACKGAGCVNGCDNGVAVFVNVTLTKLGLQTIVAADTIDGSITGLGTIMVVGADVRLSKQPQLSIAASGDTVQFRVCWSNYSSASAFSFVITDAVPMGTTFVPEAGTATFNCGSTDGVAVDVTASGSTSAVMPPAASFAAGNPPLGTRWLRWTVPMAGVQTTGCVCYRITVN